MSMGQEISLILRELQETHGLGYELAQTLGSLLDELATAPDLRARMRDRLTRVHAEVSKHNYPAKGSYVSYFLDILAEPPKPEPYLRLVYSRPDSE